MGKVLFFLLVIFLLFGLITTAYAEEKFNMSYIYFGNEKNYTYLVDNTKGSLNEVSPNYFNLTENGELDITDALDTEFIDKMHKKNIKVVPFLSNHWDYEKGRKALKNKEQLAKDIANAVKKYNLDGVGIDIENMTEAEREDYTDFVKNINNKLPSDKTIAVAVAPNPYDLDIGWQGSYDYYNLSKYCEYLMIMAYDEHYPGGPEGPVASIGFVEDSIKYALEKVSKSKIVLGIPFYGRYWNSNGTVSGEGIKAHEVEEIIKQYNGWTEFDSHSKSPKAVITIKSYDKKPKVSGKILSAGEYTIWYENEQSIKEKLKLVKKYDLKGAGSWSIGQEPIKTWDYFKLWLDGHYFSDLQGHWAQNYTLYLLNKEWMVGISDSKFAPNKKLTRAEASAILTRFLGLKRNSIKTVSFDDISNHWAQKEIEVAFKNGIIIGRDDGLFYPDEPITRQEIAAMIDRSFSIDESISNNPFYDINNKLWSYESILRLYNKGIISGYMDGSFKPHKNISRAEMAAFIYRVDLIIS